MGRRRVMVVVVGVVGLDGGWLKKAMSHTCDTGNPFELTREITCR